MKKLQITAVIVCLNEGKLLPVKHLSFLNMLYSNLFLL